MPNFDEIIVLLEKHLFENHDKEVKKDFLQLLIDYSKDSLDYLAERIELIEFAPYPVTAVLFTLFLEN